MGFSFFKRKDKIADEDFASVRQIEVARIIPNRFQPRQVFDQDAIVELAETIAAHGLLQPIVVREYEPQKYELIAGERRFRAVSYLHWTTVPAIVREFDDTQAASFAVIENLQREELSAIEEAKAYRRLMQLNQLTQVQLAKELGKSQSFIANKLRLLKLEPAVQRALLRRKISERHGRCLVALAATDQIAILNQIEQRHLTVSETEQLVKTLKEKQRPQNPKKSARRKNTKPQAVTANVKVVINTLQKSFDLIEQSGLKLTTNQEHHDGFERIIIDVPTDAKGKQED